MHHPKAASRKSVAQNAAEILARLRAQCPRVHCITNTVAQNFSANALLAAGCVPSMTLSVEEVGSFVSGAQALLVNLGTFDKERREAVTIAVESARANAVPWILDPVFVDRASTRAAFARELIGRRPNVIRLNHAEFSALTGSKVSRDAVMAFARANQTIVGLSGEVRSCQRWRTYSHRRERSSLDDPGDRHGLCRFGIGRGVSCNRAGCLGCNCCGVADHQCCRRTGRGKVGRAG